MCARVLHRARDMCFYNQVWEYDMPISTHSGIPILLPLCSVLYTHWGQCVIQVSGYEKTKHYPIFFYVISRIWLNLNSDLYFIGELNMMNT
jgi:hypothetical protein